MLRPVRTVGGGRITPIVTSPRLGGDCRLQENAAGLPSKVDGSPALRPSARRRTGRVCILFSVRPTWRALPYLLQRTLLPAIDYACFAVVKGAAYSYLLSLLSLLSSLVTLLIL